jgi:hypothetical protein
MVEAKAAAKAPEAEENASVLPLETADEILIGKNDILFGRGGLTNRHFGNKKYRDVINEYRQEYVDAKKVEKPRVAKRVVKKILSADFADTPVRFLKRDDNGLWVEVDEHEAACKVSQALREKTRWSCMKTEGTEASVAVSLKLEVEHSTATPTKKRSADGNGADVKKVLKIETTDKESGETTVKKIQVGGLKEGTPQPVKLAQQPSTPVLAPEVSVADIKPVPTAFEISVPPLEASASAMLPNDGSMPTDADVLFGRGGRTNHHPGNKRLRMIVDEYKLAYEAARKTDKPKYAKAIVQALREHSTPSRFLRMNDTTNMWEDVGDRRAAEKVSQTLREKEKSATRNDKSPALPSLAVAVAASNMALI